MGLRPTAVVYFGVWLDDDDVDEDKLRTLSPELAKCRDVLDTLSEKGAAGVWLEHVGEGSGFVLSLVRPYRAHSGRFDPTKLVTPTDTAPFKRALAVLGAEADGFGKKRKPAWGIALGEW